MDMRIQNCRVDGSIIFTQNCQGKEFMSIEMEEEELNNFTIFEIKFMEIHSFDKVAHRLWFECSQVWITNFPKQQFKFN